jgi:hypothetical protein
MEHGLWSKLWRDERRPFSKRKAEMLVVIGAGLKGLNANICAHLPSSWRILYYMAQLGRATTEALIGEDLVHPRLQLHEARELLAEFKPELVRKSTASSLTRRLIHFSKFIRRRAVTCSSTDRQLVQTELKRLLDALSQRSNDSVTHPNP